MRVLSEEEVGEVWLAFVRQMADFDDAMNEIASVQVSESQLQTEEGTRELLKSFLRIGLAGAKVYNAAGKLAGVVSPGASVSQLLRQLEDDRC